MSANDDEEMEIPGREVAYRLFAAEYDDASVSYTESDEERAPNYVIAPTGARINRLFAVGTLTEVTSVNDEMVRARVVDPTGAFVVYAGQYQPDELAFLEGIEPPAFVAVTGKARTFQPEDSEQVYTSIRPESIATVDADTRDRWVVSAAEQTLERIATYAAATDAGARGDDLTDALLEQGIEPGLAAGIPLAQEHYGTTPSYLAALRDCALEAVEVVSGDRDQVGPFNAQPGETDPEYEDATFDSLADLGVDAVDRSVLEAASSDAEQEPAVETASEPESEPEAVAATAGGDTVESSSAAGTATSDARDGSAETDLETESDASDDTGVELESESVEGTGDAGAESETEPEPASESESDATAASDIETDASESADESADAAAADAEIDDGVGAEGPAADEGEDEDLGDFDADDIGDGMYEMDDEEREQLEEEFGAEFTTGAEVEEPGEAGIDVPEPDEEDADAAADAATEAESETDLEASTEAEPETGVDDDLGAPPTSGLEDEASESADETETDAESDAELEEPEDETAEETDAEPDEPESEPESESAADESEDETADESDDEPAEDVDLQDYVVETMAELDDGDGADRSELIETVAADTGASEDEVEDAIQDALMGGQCYEPDDETLKPI